MTRGRMGSTGRRPNGVGQGELDSGVMGAVMLVMLGIRAAVCVRDTLPSESTSLGL
jgi:hypothetical protein